MHSVQPARHAVIKTNQNTPAKRMLFVEFAQSGRVLFKLTSLIRRAARLPRKHLIDDHIDNSIQTGSEQVD